MGNLVKMCGCDNDDESKYIKTDYDPLGGLNLPNKSMTRLSDGVVDKSLLEKEVPANIIDIKIGKKDLIKKREENPYDHYRRIAEIGNGSFGVVYKVASKSAGIERAMKVISKEYISKELNANQVANEISILRVLDHPNILKIFEFFEDEDNFYIVTEYCDQGDLGKKIGDQILPEFVVKYFMRQVFESIAYLHSKNIIHGDIKRENILLYSKKEEPNDIKASLLVLAEDKDVQNELISIKKTYSTKAKDVFQKLCQYEAKLADFGCAKMFHNKKIQGIIGTTYYCSPEVLRNEYREECDEWSCGVLMYLLLTGMNPFDGATEEEVIKSILYDPVNLKIPAMKNVSMACKNLIFSLLKKDPTERIRAVDALNHDFFKEMSIIEEMKEDRDDSELFLNFRNTMKNKSKFKDTVIAYISLNFVKKEEEEKIKEVFKKLSNDHTTYKIDKEQFLKYIKENTTINEDEADQMFIAIDSDQNGTIEYQELINALSDKKKLLTKSNLQEAFDFFDTDKSGTISWGEINQVISGGKDSSDTLMNEFLTEIGKKENEEITFEEFCHIVTDIE